ncbi:MAG: diphthine--ammonia ligase [Candidatus Aenigmarchaeota archaeon]|nr:diphthine--ammonia ligase [Candidatus Aenigmarchaeota archaeon]
MKLAALVSGGKDSLYSMFLAKREHEISVFVSIKSENPESYMFHVPGIDIVKLQAESMNIPIIFKETKGVKEEELNDLKDALKEAKKKYEIEGVVSGAIYSKYQKDRIEKICNELQLKSITPIWGAKTGQLWKDMIDAGFDIIVIAVAASGLDKSWLGRKIDKKAVVELTNLHDTCYVCTGFEGGEAESLVLNCPMFSKKIKIIESEIKWDNKTQSGELIIKKAELI